MTTYTELNNVSDVIKEEFGERSGYCRKVCEVYAGQVLAVGDVCQDYSSSNDAKKQVTGAVSDVQTMTFQAGADGGVFALGYKGLATALLAYNVSAADMQVALRALHADLAACVVSTVGGVGVDYVVTTAGALTDITIAADGILDGAVAEPATIVHTTQGVISGGGADSICLEAASCVNEVQTIVFGGTPTGGTFTLTVVDKEGDEVETAAIAYNASAATITTAIDTALGESGQIVCTGTTLPDHTLTFTWSGASYSGRPQELIDADLTSLTGGTPTAVEARTTAGAQGECVLLVRGPAVVDYAYLDFNSVTEANAIAALADVGIQVRTGPTYSTIE